MTLQTYHDPPDLAATARDPWWDYACGAAAALLAGFEPPALPTYGPVLDHDETVYIQTEAHYSRLRGGDGTYGRSRTMMLGGLGLTLGMLAAQSYLDRRHRRRAERDDMPAWRDQAYLPVTVTTHRLLCPSQDGQLESFWFVYATEFYPDLQHRSVTIAFGDECSPLRLAGPAAPAIALWSAVEILGPRWHDDLRLAPLLGGHQRWA